MLDSAYWPTPGVDGNYYVEIYNSTDFGTLSQTISGLTVGLEYELSFLWGNRIRGYDFTVEIGGSSFSAAGSGESNMVSESFTFLASNTSEILSITWNDSGSDSVSGGALDAFKLTAVPIPAAVWLFGSGIIGLIGVARRKKK